MRISVVSHRNATLDPAVKALVWSLAAVGHRVTVICVGEPSPGLPEGVEVRAVATDSGSLIERISRRLGMGARSRAHDALLMRALADTGPELVYPHRSDDVDLADGAGAPVLAQPGWPSPKNDFIATAATATSSLGDALPGEPEPGRHSGQTVVVAYRETPTSPGRYLESAFRRSGAHVVAFDGELDWDRVPSGAACVVLVESPYPPLSVTGEKKDVPVLFWVHHGEHHLPANIRLAWRYQVDTVLLAHSLHLAHRFPVPTQFFPFAVPTELFGGSRPWEERAYDVAMVGAGIDGSGGRYDTRRRLVGALRADDTLRSRLTYGVAPEEMARLYGDARLVLNDGGPRHFPITMRVFEALGAGALLLSEDIPGMSGLLGDRYAVIDDDVVGRAHALLSAGDSPARAAEAHRWATSRHTYDHRVDDLLAIASDISPQVGSGPPWAAETGLARVVDRDVDAQHIAVFGEVAPLGLADRAVRRGEGRGLRERSIDAVVIGGGPVDDLEGAVRAARGYVYAGGDNLPRVAGTLDAVRPDAPVSVDGGVLRADLGGTGYRMREADHPLAR